MMFASELVMCPSDLDVEVRVDHGQLRITAVPTTSADRLWGIRARVDGRALLLTVRRLPFIGFRSASLHRSLTDQVDGIYIVGAPQDSPRQIWSRRGSR